MPLKIIFMGTPEFAVPILKTIHDSKHEILAVYTQSPKKKNRGLKKFSSPVQSFAEKNELINKGVVFFMSEINWSKKTSDKKITLTNGEIINFSWLINCSGLYADKTAHKFNVGLDYNLMPFKGIYWAVRKNSEIKINRNIYPVPDLNVPFLGVHLTPSSQDDGDISIGPTANFSLGRENYKNLESVEPIESLKNLLIITNQYLQNKNGFKKDTSKKWTTN